MAFVSFKDKNCVTETIDEIDIVKTKLVGKEHYDALEIKNWEVDNAVPTNDIIWPEINKGQDRSIIIKGFLILLPFITSVFVITGITYLD